MSIERGVFWQSLPNTIRLSHCQRNTHRYTITKYPTICELNVFAVTVIRSFKPLLYFIILYSMKPINDSCHNIFV